MAYSLRCADSRANCPGEFTTETEEELMRHVEMHAQTAHPEMTLDDETVGQMKGLVKQR